MKKILRGFLAVLVAAGMLGTISAGAQPAEGEFTVQPQEPSAEQLPRMESAVYLQNGMRAVVITPGVDFAQDAEASESDIRGELTQLYVKLIGLKMNAVIIRSANEGEALFDLDMGMRDALAVACEAARTAGI